MSRYFIIAAMLFFLSGCQGLQVNVPVEVQSISQSEAALLVYVENKSSHSIKITYPVSTDFLKKNQHTVFPVPRPGNYKIVLTAFTEDRRYRDVYQPISTVEIPIFLNGYDLVRAKGQFVGYHLEVTDGMIFGKW